MEQSTEKEKITRLGFEAIGKEWTQLDTEYDNLFQAFLNNPHIKSTEELSAFKAMQNRLYAIELELYKVAEGKMIIEE